MIVFIYYCPEEADKGDYSTPIFRVCISHSRQSLTITTNDRYIWAVCCRAPRRMRALNQGIFTSGAGQSWQSYLCVRRGSNHLDWKKSNWNEIWCVRSVQRKYTYTLAKSNVRFFETQKSTWCLDANCTIFGRFMKSTLGVISYEKYIDFMHRGLIATNVFFFN